MRMLVHSIFFFFFLAVAIGWTLLINSAKVPSLIVSFEYPTIGRWWQREKIDWQEPCKFDCWLELDEFYFLLSLVNFHKLLASSQKIKILNPHWAYFHFPGAILCKNRKNS